MTITKRVPSGVAESTTIRVLTVGGNAASVSGNTWNNTWGSSWGTTWGGLLIEAISPSPALNVTARVTPDISENTTKRI